jgi:hypothetical protein
VSALTNPLGEVVEFDEIVDCVLIQITLLKSSDHVDRLVLCGSSKMLGQLPSE